MKKNTNKPAWRQIRYLSAAGLSALLAPSAEAVEALLTADAYVSASQPATNFGAAEALQVGSGNRTLLRFDVASMVPAGTVANQVSRAVLNVWVSGVTKAGSVEVSELIGTWTEPGITEATAPGATAGGATSGTTVLSAGPAFQTKPISLAGQWVSIPVTNQVKKWLSNPTTNSGLLIAPAAAAPNTAVTFDSKENTATSHPAWLEIELTGRLGGPYVLTVGKKNANDSTGRTQLAVPDFATLTEALNKIPNVYNNGTCSARYLIKVLPGVYAERVTMKPCVDIEGSGELTTRITAAGGANWDAASATVAGANEAELRFLTVENTGGNAYALGIYNTGASPRLTHVTAAASGGTYDNTGVCNSAGSSPAMTNVTTTGSGGTYSFGVDNRDASSPTMTNVTATGSGGSESNYGMYNHNASAPKMANVTATGSGGISSFGVYNSSSSPTMANVTASGSGGFNNSNGVYNNSSSPIMANVTATGSGGSYAYGVNNRVSSSPTMTNVTATGLGSNTTYGIYNESSSPTMENVTASGSGAGLSNYGVLNSSSLPTIHRSTLRGTNALVSQNNSTVRVGASQINGWIITVNSTVTCAASYSGNFVALNASCQ